MPRVFLVKCTQRGRLKAPYVNYKLSSNLPSELEHHNKSKKPIWRPHGTFDDVTATEQCPSSAFKQCHNEGVAGGPRKWSGSKSDADTSGRLHREMCSTDLPQTNGTPSQCGKVVANNTRSNSHVDCNQYRSTKEIVGCGDLDRRGAGDRPPTDSEVQLKYFAPRDCRWNDCVTVPTDRRSASNTNTAWLQWWTRRDVKYALNDIFNYQDYQQVRRQHPDPDIENLFAAKYVHSTSGSPVNSPCSPPDKFLADRHLQITAAADISTSLPVACAEPEVRSAPRLGGPEPPPRFECDACAKSYSTHNGLSKHRQFHCVAARCRRQFVCPHCSASRRPDDATPLKTYSSTGALKMHVRTHTLPCRCRLCGKAFSRPWLLQGHLRTHTGEKPFTCPECQRAFADRSNLRAHLQTHAGIRRYRCTGCSRTFSRMSLLLKHRESGSGCGGE